MPYIKGHGFRHIGVSNTSVSDSLNILCSHSGNFIPILPISMINTMPLRYTPYHPLKAQDPAN